MHESMFEHVWMWVRVCVSMHIWKMWEYACACINVSVRICMSCMCDSLQEHVTKNVGKHVWVWIRATCKSCVYGCRVLLQPLLMDAQCLLRDLLSPCSVYMWLKTVFKAMAQMPYSPICLDPCTPEFISRRNLSVEWVSVGCQSI